jgi:hypothetical protein
MHQHWGQYQKKVRQKFKLAVNTWEAQSKASATTSYTSIHNCKQSNSVHFPNSTLDMFTKRWQLTWYTYCHLSHAIFSTNIQPNSGHQIELQRSNKEIFCHKQSCPGKHIAISLSKKIIPWSTTIKLTLAEDPALLNEPLKPFLVIKPCPGQGIQRAV